MAQTELDVKKVMILLQRRYNFIREISTQTKELEEALARNDDVSISLILQMRADSMGKFDDCTGEIWRLAEDNRKAQEKLRLLMMLEPKESMGESPEEKKIYEIRRKTQNVIDGLRKVDERLNRRLTGDKSYYEKQASRA